MNATLELSASGCEFMDGDISALGKFGEEMFLSRFVWKASDSNSE
jgi:hypothetical protein